MPDGPVAPVRDWSALGTSTTASMRTQGVRTDGSLRQRQRRRRMTTVAYLRQTISGSPGAS
jgi:hypothetical protein